MEGALDKMFTVNINGTQYSSTTDKKLLPFLRDDLNITSVKKGCDGGACGTCMVLIDGKASKACVFSLSKLSEKEVITVEGLTDRERDVYSHAFSKMGAVQCGFCIPGMVISAAGLIRVCADPTPDQVKQAIKNNICRCTGYVKIEKAILLAAEMLRENIEIPSDKTKGGVGESTYRIDAQAKVLGTAEYVDDIRDGDVLYGGAVRTKYARAIVESIDVSQAKALDGVVSVVTADDIPGKRIIGHLRQDWDVLVEQGNSTKCIGDAIVLIAAESKEILEAAKKLVKIEYTELVPLKSPIEAMADGAPSIHEQGNILAEEHLTRGDADTAIKNSKYVVTNKYSTPFTEHAFLEPESAIAKPYDNDRIVIYCADQGVYQTRHECADMLGVDEEKIRVIAKTVGGGFGGKEDMSVQHHAALLAFITKSAVKVSLSREESIKVHPKRHAMEMEITTACDENGIITAMKAVIVSDTGAYASLGGPVLQRACTHAAGPYNFHNIDILGKAVYTNNPPAGAYRGFGVTQSCFASEMNLNKLAQLVGISPFEIRYRNAVRPGQVLPNGQIADESTAIVETLDAVRDIMEKNPKAGIACAMKNAGLGVGVPDIGRCTLAIEDGKVHIRTSAACIGQGMGTVVTQIVCETTGVCTENIVHDSADTDITPNSGNTTASRQTVFTGEASRTAALKLKQELDTVSGLESLNGKEFYGEYFPHTDKMGSDKENPISHVSYGYATQVVQLDDDGMIKTVTAAHDVGRAINPTLVEAQVEGGVVMSLGYALTEDFPLKDGVPQAKFGTLGLFKSTQVPQIDTIIIEKCDSETAYGAKGVGEICSIPTAPAVALAYYNRDGEFRVKLPMGGTPYSRNKK